MALARREFSRILCILLSPIGDTLFATPAIHALRQHFPLSYIAAVVYPTNKAILECNPDLDEIFVHPIRHPVHRWTELPKLFGELRKRRFELTIDFCGLTLFLSRIVCGAPHRITTPFPNWWWLIPTNEKTWGRTHAVDHFLKVLDPLGIPSPKAPKPRIYLSERDRLFANQCLEDIGIARDDLVIAIHPGGEGLGGKKRWGKERFAQVADAVAERYGAKVLLLGGGDEQGLASAVARLMRTTPIDRAGKTTLKQTAALIQRSALFIGNDSSPLHIAAALGKPVVGIYGPSNPDNFRPYATNYRLLQKHPPCNPCFHFVGTVPLWKFAGCNNRVCLTGTTPEEVLEAVDSLLA